MGVEGLTPRQCATIVRVLDDRRHDRSCFAPERQDLDSIIAKLEPKARTAREVSAATATREDR